MIVATAGHVDHGKSSLIRALTGVETDRIPEEKTRGLSIELGYAYWDRGDGEIIGFVDVPGHERFIANMLAGVGTLDAALLVVAADEGIMPQTREHLEILDLLGCPRGIVALTKTDRSTADRIGDLEIQIQELVQDTCLEGASVFHCSAITGEGLDALTQHLGQLARVSRPRNAGFRLAIDRVFDLPGIGLTVTGAVTNGVIGIGDPVLVSPGGLNARIRSIHAQGQEATQAEAGRRCSLTLTGPSIDRSHVRRGQWAIAADRNTDTDRFDAILRSSAPTLPFTKKSFSTRLHIGTVNVNARIVLLDPARKDGTMLAQVRPDQPVDTVWGDTFILRDPNGRESLMGGRVITPFGVKRGRSKPDRIAYLQALSEVDPKTSLTELLKIPPYAVDTQMFATTRNLGNTRMRDIIGTTDLIEAESSNSTACVLPKTWQSWQTAIVVALKSAHEQSPEKLGPSPHQLHRTLSPDQPPQSLMPALIGSLIGKGTIAVRAGSVHLASHQPQLPQKDEAVWRKIERELSGRAPSVPVIHEIAEMLDLDPGATRKLMARVAALNLAIQISKNRYALPKTVHHWAAEVETLSELQDGFSAVAFKSHAGIGRNLAIEVLEFFDRTGFTRRENANRTLLQTAKNCFGSY